MAQISIHSDIPHPRDPCSTPMGREILEKVADRKYRFIFPSQVAADSWAKALSRHPHVRAVETERFLGWDSFVDSLRPEPAKGETCADQATRLVWAARCVNKFEEIGISPREMINLARLAPRLREISKQLIASGKLETADSPSGVSSRLVERYFRYSADYGHFLTEHGLYETAHREPDPRILVSSGNRFLVLGSDAISSYQPTLDFFRAACPEALAAIETFDPQPQESSKPHVFRYHTLKDELDDIFGIFSRLADSGIALERMALSVPGISPAWKAHLQRQAKLRGMELNFKSGEALADSAFGVLLASLREAAGEGFSSRSLRRLALPGAFPWKQPQVARKLARIAERKFVPESSADPRRMREIWRRIGIANEAEPAFDFLKELERHARLLSSAKDFSSLREAIFAFRTALLDETSIPPVAQRTLERILKELSALEHATTLSGGSLEDVRPFDLLLADLELARYSPKDVDARSALPVYPYALSPALAADFHVLVEASQDSARELAGSARELPEELKPFFADESELDREYFRSMRIEGAVFAHARRGLDGFSVLHPELSALAAMEIETESIEPSPEWAEQNLWSAGGQTASAMLDGEMPACSVIPALRFFAAKPHRERPGAGLSGRESRATMLGPIDGGSLVIKLSPSKLGEFLFCPFRWFASCFPDLAAPSENPVAMAEGSLMHALIRDLLSDSPARPGDNGATLNARFDRCLRDTLRSASPSLEPDLEAARAKILDRISRLLEEEKEFEAAGWDRGEFEVPLKRAYPEWGVSFEGRADRIAKRLAENGEERFAIVDYKKKTVPGESSYTLSENGTLEDFQIAGYSRMLESTGVIVETALYWSVEDGKKAIVFGPGGARMDRAAFEPEIEAMERSLALVAKAIRNEEYIRVTPSSRACEKCAHRRLCRVYFSTERL